MEKISHPQTLQKTLRALSPRPTIGFVPTMGALHEGHAELIKQCGAENEITVVSIFVNPTQFNNATDLEKYPSTIEKDLSVLESLGVDYVFLPQPQNMYPDAFNYSVHEKEKNSVLCGASRPGHFQGVLTVVLKLLNIVQPTQVYFGEKDFQQLELIRGMVESFFIPTEVIGVPTYRDADGLALSSRNKRLDEAGLIKAKFFARSLAKKASIEEIKKELVQNDIKVDYVEELWGRRFGAVFVDDVRLIDNVAL